MQARGLAIDAAKEKALTYSQARSSIFKTLMHSFCRDSGVHELIDPADPGRQTLDPGAIEVAAAVIVAFSLKQKG